MTFASFGKRIFRVAREKGWLDIMNIEGVTQTAQVLPDSQAQPPQQQVQAPEQSQPTGADTVNLSAQVSMQVLDMAQKQFEEAANNLISQMAAVTGVGQNVDVST